MCVHIQQPMLCKNNLFLNDLSVHNLIYLARQDSVYNFYYRDVLIYFKVVDKFNF